MPIYRYQSVSTTVASGGGAMALRTIEAPDRASAVRLLVQRGETPTRIDELSENGSANAAAMPGFSSSGSTSSSPFRLASPVMSRGETASFIRELATAVNAGLPLIASLKTIARQGRSERQKYMMVFLIERVEAGDPLSDAMSSFGKPFGDLIVNLVRAGEAAGRLGETLKHAADLMDRDLKLRRSVLGSLLYPIIIGVLVSLAVAIVVTVIVPRVLKAVEGQGAIRMPWPTQVVQQVAFFFGDYWWLLLGGIAIGVWLFNKAYQRPETRLAIDRTLLATPLIGPMLRDVAVARFTRTLGTLVGSGLPVLASLRITKATLGNRAMEASIDHVTEAVAGGSTIAEPMEQTAQFPSLLVQIVSLGERTGKLDEMLMQAAAAFDDKTEQTIKVVTTVLPPLLIVTLAMIVGFVVLSILMPLLELQDAASRAM